jgi:hypothetical protein
MQNPHHKEYGRIRDRMIKHEIPAIKQLGGVLYHIRSAGGAVGRELVREA